MNIIEFPNLWGLKFSVSPVAFKLFGLSIYWYGIIIAAGFMLAVFLGMRDSKKFGIDQENIIDLVLYATPAAIICARLYYVIFKWSEYKNDLKEIINTRHGGLAIYGGIIGAFITAYIFCRIKKIRTLKMLDFGVPYIALAQSIGRWGNFVNQEAFGTNTTLPWGMTSERIKDVLSDLQAQGVNVNPALPVHPTFLYESLWNLAVFFFLIRYRKGKKVEGEVFFLYMILYGIGRFFIEGLRTDSLMLGNLRISQVLAFLFVVVFGILLYFRRKRGEEIGTGEVELGTSEYGTVLKRLKDDEDTGADTVEESREAGQSELEESPVEPEDEKRIENSENKTPDSMTDNHERNE